MPTSPAVVAVDLGKSRCRVVVSESDALLGPRPARRLLYEGVGAPGLAATGGVASALDSILPLRAHLDVPISSISVGAAGAWTAPTAASELARRLSDALDVSAVVTSDIVSAHAGALGGDAGVLLIAGTGAAALRIDDTRTDASRTGGGRAVLVDGWGPELGDFGSGSWLGREALRAVLRASVGLGPRTRLTDAVAIPIGAPSAIHAWLADDGPLPRRLATLAPLVLDAAESGDGVAAEIAAKAIRLLAASAVAAAAPAASAPAAFATASASAPAATATATSATATSAPAASSLSGSSGGGVVALHGGLTEHAWFRAGVEQALRASGHPVVVSAGDALDGALLLAGRADLPHERFVHRAE